MTSSTNKKMARFVVCGATGFIGRNIALRLAALYPGRVAGIYFQSPPPQIPGLKWIQADLRDAKQVDDIFQEDDVVIQAAAVTSGAKDIVERPYIHTTDNAIINSLILRACYENKTARFIFFSCACLYESVCGRGLTEEDATSELRPGNPYMGIGSTKIYVEKMCHFYSTLGRTRHTVMRLTNVYGPYDKYDLDRSHMYGANVSKVMTAKDGDCINIWGPGTEGRDMLYVDDLVDFIQASLEQQTAFELVNTGYGKSHTVNEIVETIVAMSGKKIDIAHDLSRPHIPSNIWVDNTKAYRLFNWRPKTSLTEGTKKTLQWHKNYFGSAGELP